MIRSISVLVGSDLFGLIDSDELEHIDVAESMEKYCDRVCDDLKTEFPDANISVVDAGAPDDSMVVDADSSDEEDIVGATVREIMEDVSEENDWVMRQE